MKPKPFVKWAGGKTYLLPELEPIIDNIKSKHPDIGYCEPMAGGGAVYWAICNRFERRVIADINNELINLYNTIRDMPRQLISELQSTKYKFINKADEASLATYHTIRSSEPTDQIERAARLMFLLKTCFNGLMRVNKSGKFNVPPGSYTNPKICDGDVILADSAALQNTTILCGNATDTVSALQSPHLVFLDPPYYGDGKFTGYSGKFDLEEQEKLVRTVLDSDCPFIYTNRNHPAISSLFEHAGNIDIKIVPLKHSVQPRYTTGLIEQELIIYRN